MHWWLIKHYLRRWYWTRTPMTRKLIQSSPDWVFAILLGLAIAWLAAEGL